MAGTVTATKNYLSSDKKILEIKVACVGGAAGESPDVSGTVPDTIITDAVIGDIDGYSYSRGGFQLVEVVTVPGETAPDAADLTITDALGAQLYDADDIISATAVSHGTVTARLVTSPLVIHVENQATADAEWNIYLRLKR